MIVKSKCEYCGGPFEGRRGKRFCTKRCAMAEWWLLNRTRFVQAECVECGQIFERGRKDQRFCSDYCQQVSWINRNHERVRELDRNRCQRDYDKRRMEAKERSVPKAPTLKPNGKNYSMSPPASARNVA